MNHGKILLEVLVSEGYPHVDEALTLARAVADRFDGVEVRHVDVHSRTAQDKGLCGPISLRIGGMAVDVPTTEQGAPPPARHENHAVLPPEWLLEAGLLRVRRPKGILFLCVANSARSQMAEGIARSMASDDVQVWSAGSKPTRVRPEAITVLTEIGIDLSTHYSKPVSEVPAERVDTVITLCAEEECPVFLGQATRLHWGLPDPASVDGDEKKRLEAFRHVRDILKKRLSYVFG